MDIFHDFAAHRRSDASRHSLEQTERLLNCFQRALGDELPDRLLAIQGLIRLMTEESAECLDDEARGHLTRLAAVARRTDALVRALAEIGRLCRAPPPSERVSLAEVVREAAAEANLLSGGRSVAYHFQDVMPVFTLPRRALYQVLLELVRNAVQAGTPERPLQVEVGAAPAGGGVEVWVADNGQGIPEARRDVLFDPFAPRNASSTGPGLGLFLVSQVVASWGGAIRIQSEEGRGTRVTLLVRPPEGIAAPARAPVREPPPV
jgi:signal transduction histidine kinase